MIELPVPVPNAGWDPRILAFASGSTVTTFAVVTKRWTVVVDTLYSRKGAEELKRHLSGNLLAVNTHSDWDHAWGNPCFDFVVATRRCAERLRAAQPELDQKRREDPERFEGAGLRTPDVTFEGEAEIDGGDLTLHLLPAPGHAPDQVVVWIPEIRTLLTADAAEHPLPFVEGPGHLRELTDTLQRMKNLKPETLLACHAPCDGDPGLLDRNLEYFERIRAAARRHPETPMDHPDLETALGFPYHDPADAFYREAHQRALRAALAER